MDYENKKFDQKSRYPIISSMKDLEYILCGYNYY